jgi:uncharacterized membrane protein
MNVTTIDPVWTPRRSHRGTLAALGLALVIAVTFVAVAALPYFSLNEARFGPYWPKRGWLLAHIVGGMVALLSGPFQLWLGLTDRGINIHRRLGVVYVSGMALGSTAAFYLAFHTDFGWVFGAGLVGLACAWIITTGMAIIAIKRHQYEHHKEWMLRSYVVTFAFVTFRFIQPALMAAGVGTIQEQLAAASWACWAIPLLVTEVVLQGKKIA